VERDTWRRGKMKKKRREKSKLIGAVLTAQIRRPG
jgi:hypothetical protein